MAGKRVGVEVSKLLSHNLASFELIHGWEKLLPRFMPWLMTSLRDVGWDVSLAGSLRSNTVKGRAWLGLLGYI